MKRIRIKTVIAVSSSNAYKARSIFHSNKEEELKKVVKLNRVLKTHTIKSLTI